jgi:hypothetical protein
MPRKSLKERQQKKVTDTDNDRNRVRAVVDGLVGTESADDIMLELLEVIQESPKVPVPGKFYIFVYRPKTPGIQYDQNPFVAVTDVFSWGFRGINFHWEQTRQYTWDEIPGKIYEVYPAEVKDLQELPFANIRLNS